MKKYLAKEYRDYHILIIGILVVALLSPVNIVINHYMHLFAVPFGLVVACYGIYVITERTVQPEKWHKWVAVGVSVIVVLIWALGVNRPTDNAYIGSETFVIKNENDHKQIPIADYVKIGDNVKGIEYIIFFNPNCETCRDTIPKLFEGLNNKTNILKRVAFVDTTQPYGKELAQEFGVEYVPSYAVNAERGEVIRLAYHTNSGTKFYQQEIIKLHSYFRMENN